MREQVVAVHWSPPFEGPLKVPFDDVQPYYAAYKLFHDIVESGKYKIEFKLKQGDTVIFNQRRYELFVGVALDIKNCVPILITSVCVCVFVLPSSPHYHRVLHGRNQFSADSNGVRHLQGTYLNIDDALCRFNALRYRFAADSPTVKNRRVANGNFA